MMITFIINSPQGAGSFVLFFQCITSLPQKGKTFMPVVTCGKPARVRNPPCSPSISEEEEEKNHQPSILPKNPPACCQPHFPLHVYGNPTVLRYCTVLAKREHEGEEKNCLWQAPAGQHAPWSFCFRLFLTSLWSPPRTWPCCGHY